jgi:hypothetical protein
MANKSKESLSPTERQAYWPDQLLQWAQSGLTQKQFCKERELSPDAFAWWKARYRNELNLPYRPIKARSTKKHKHRFVEVKVSPDTTVLLYEVRSLIANLGKPNFTGF